MYIIKKLNKLLTKLVKNVFGSDYYKTNNLSIRAKNVNKNNK